MTDPRKASTFYHISNSLSIGSFKGRTDEIKEWQRIEREQSYIYDYDEKTGELKRRWNYPYAGMRKITKETE